MLQNVFTDIYFILFHLFSYHFFFFLTLPFLVKQRLSYLGTGLHFAFTRQLHCSVGLLLRAFRWQHCFQCNDGISVNVLRPRDARIRFSDHA